MGKRARCSRFHFSIFCAAVRRERIDPVTAHLAENGRSDGGIAGEVSVVWMAGDEVALAQVTSGVEAVPLVERMLDIAKRQNSSDRGCRSRGHNSQCKCNATRIFLL